MKHVDHAKQGFTVSFTQAGMHFCTAITFILSSTNLQCTFALATLCTVATSTTVRAWTCSLQVGAKVDEKCTMSCMNCSTIETLLSRRVPHIQINISHVGLSETVGTNCCRGRDLDCELKQFRLMGDVLMEASAALVRMPHSAFSSSACLSDHVRITI